jgi:hypothetical protein
MTYRYNVEMTLIRAGLYRATETNTGVDLGRVCEVASERSWFAGYLCGRAGLVKHATLEGARVEIERYCRDNPGEIDRAYRAILAARGRVVAPEPQEPAPELQGAMPL